MQQRITNSIVHGNSEKLGLKAQVRELVFESQAAYEISGSSADGSFLNRHSAALRWLCFPFPAKHVVFSESSWTFK